MRTPDIDYVRLGRAVDLYKQSGYEYRDMPWTVPPHISALTCPDETKRYKLGPLDELVGSAEQSALYLMSYASRSLCRGRWVMCTPCFRANEPNDVWHHAYFMKVELFHVQPDDPKKALHTMIQDVRRTLQLLEPVRLGQEDLTTELTLSDTSYDLNLDGIEIGSYGIRTVFTSELHADPGITYVYGTGLAEPRFGYALFQKRVKSGAISF